MNPSRSAVIYDRKNNVHIQPGQRVTRQPDNQLVQTGKLLHIHGQEALEAYPEQYDDPIILVSTLELADDVPQAPEDAEETPSPRRRKRA